MVNGTDNETLCKVCSRKLTRPDSVARGMGLRCFKKFMAGYVGIQDRLVKEIVDKCTSHS